MKIEQKIAKWSHLEMHVDARSADHGVGSGICIATCGNGSKVKRTTLKPWLKFKVQRRKIGEKLLSVRNMQKVTVEPTSWIDSSLHQSSMKTQKIPLESYDDVL